MKKSPDISDITKASGPAAARDFLDRAKPYTPPVASARIVEVMQAAYKDLADRAAAAANKKL